MNDRTQRPLTALLALGGTLVALACAGDANPPAAAEIAGPVALAEHGGGPPHSVTFVSARDGNREIYVMNADGSDPVRLTFHPAFDITPAWSPDGRFIVFASQRDAGDNEVYLMNADGTDQHNITNAPSATDAAPVFSPDGKWIVFHSTRAGTFDLWMMRPDGSDLAQLTNTAAPDQYPDWSPNGKTIVFQRDGDIYLLDVPTGTTTLLWNDPVFSDMPSFSPNGKQVAFMSRAPGYPAIYVIDVDGGTPVNITPIPAGVPVAQWQNMFPEFSRNGREVYFISVRPGTGLTLDIFATTLDGAEVRQLTTTPGFDSAPETR